MSYFLKQRFHMRANNEMLLSRAIAAVGFALSSTIFSIYFSSIGLTNGQIGIMTGLASMVVVLSSPLAPILLEKFNEIKLYAAAVMMMALNFAALGKTSAIPIAIGLYVISRVIVSIVFASGSIAFRDLSGTRAQFTKAQGLASSVINLGWVMGPLIGALALDRLDISGTFYLGAGITALAAILLWVMPIRLREKKRQKIDSSWRGNLAFYISRPTLRKAYAFSIGRNIWWAFIFTFIPLYMLDADYSLRTIGLMMAATQLPLFLLEFKTVDAIKPFGYRNIFAICYGSITALMLAAFIVNSLPLILAGCIVGSLALCFLEPINEVYLYDQVTSLEEEKAYPVYNTAGFASSILGRTGAGVVIGLFGARYGYLFVALVLLGVTALSLTLPKKQE